MRSVGRSPTTALAPMASTISIPDATSPKIVYLPVSAGWSARQMKNWLPPLSGLEGRSTAATEPRVMGCAENSAFSRPSPPVP